MGPNDNKRKLQFGMSEDQAVYRRESRVKGVLIDAVIEVMAMKKENKIMRDGLLEISKGTYEANPWTIVPTSDALIAQKILKEVGESI